MAKSSVSSKGLTTVPVEVRRALKVRDGDRLEWELVAREGENIAVVRRTPDPYAYLKGRLKDPKLTYDKVEHLADELALKEAGR